MTTAEIPPLQAAEHDRPPDILIRPTKGWQKIGFGELWRFRHLVYLFVLRDITVRYKQTFLGGLWAIIQPLVQVVVFTLFFGKLMGMEDKVGQYNGQNIPYPVYALSGQMLWNFFASCTSASANSLLANANILRKIYVPRLVMPLASTGAAIADTLIAFGLLLGMMLYYGLSFNWLISVAPLMILVSLFAALSFGIFLSALIVTYRDFRFVVPFMLNIMFFLTPVIYPPSIVPEKYSMFLYLNPMTGVVETFRALMLQGPIDPQGLMISAATSLVLMTMGLFYFARVERRFADIA